MSELERHGDGTRPSPADALMRQVSAEVTRRMRAIGEPVASRVGGGAPRAADQAREAAR